MMTSSDVTTRRRPCPVCLTANLETPPGPYSRDGWPIIECAECGFVHLRDVPETHELEEALAWERSYDTEKQRRKARRPLLQWLSAKTRWRLHLLPRVEGLDILHRMADPGPALDLGCGNGSNLVRFGNKFTPYGVEISRSLAAEARRKAAVCGGEVIQGSSAHGLSQFPDNFFTAALLRSYLEHDSEAREVMHLLYRKMAPQGRVAVKVPNYGSLNRRIMGTNWCGFRVPDHVNYFTRKHLTRLVTEAGFQASIPAMLALPTNDNMLALLTK